MKWIQAGSYLIQPTEEGIPVAEIPSVPGMPQDAVVVYDGGEHALFFRNKKEGIILDFLNDLVKEMLMKAETMAICEISAESGAVAPIYRVPIIRSEEKINIETYRERSE